jgi:hypothetical protein
MRSPLHRVFVVALAGLLAAALLVGAAHATTHATDSTGECATCVLSHHASAVAASGAPAPTPLWVPGARVFGAPDVALPARVARTSSRGPPAGPSTTT